MFRYKSRRKAQKHTPQSKSKNLAQMKRGRMHSASQRLIRHPVHDPEVYQEVYPKYTPKYTAKGLGRARAHSGLFQGVCFRPCFFPAHLLLLAFEWNGRPPRLQGVCFWPVFFSGLSTSIGFGWDQQVAMLACAIKAEEKIKSIPYRKISTFW